MRHGLSRPATGPSTEAGRRARFSSMLYYYVLLYGAMSLRLKLLVSIAVGVLLTFLLGAAMIYAHATAKVATEMEAALAVGARIVTNTVDDFDQVGNVRRRLELLVADFDGDRHLRAEVVDAAGTRLFTSRVAAPDQPAPDWFYALLKGRFDKVEVALPKAFDEVGKLSLEADSRNEVGEVWADAMKTLSLLALLVGVILAIVATLLGAALRPLDRLATAFGQIGGNVDEVHVPERGPVEMLRVYQAFNRMVDRLGRSEIANRRLNEQLLTVQEEERADIARDLHDEIGPFLFAVDVEAAAIGRLADERKAEAIPERVRSIRDSVGHMQAHVRGILARLRPAALLDLGLAHAIDNLVASWRARHPGIAFAVDIAAPSLDERTEAAIYRVVQEALSNAVRHGAPSRVGIAIGERDGGIAITVTDDGRGLAADDAHGFGIPGMRERMSLGGGRLEVRPRAEGGVVVAGWLPLPGARSAPQPRQSMPPEPRA